MSGLSRAIRRRLRAMRDELELEEGAKAEVEERGVDWPLERDDPLVERSHPGKTPDLLPPPPEPRR